MAEQVQLQRAPSHSHQEARMLFRFIYRRPFTDKMVAYFETIPHIDKFCSFDVVTEDGQQGTEFITHFLVRSRPSVFKHLPEEGQLLPASPLHQTLKDFLEHYATQPNFKSYQGYAPTPKKSCSPYIFKMLMSQSCSLAGIMERCLERADYELYTHLFNNFQNYRLYEMHINEMLDLKENGRLKDKCKFLPSLVFWLINK